MYLKIANFITKEDPSSTVNLISVMVSEALHLHPLQEIWERTSFYPTLNPLLLLGISKELWQPAKETARDQHQRRLLCKKVLLGERRKG